MGKKTSLSAFITLLMFPTLVTMLISGFWHGAGYLFVLWGLLHGLFLCVNHAWRLLVPRLWRDKQRYERMMNPVGFVLTFVSVAVAMVIFRAPTLREVISRRADDIVNVARASAQGEMRHG